MRAEEGDESIRDYAHEADETQRRLEQPSLWGRLRKKLGRLTGSAPHP